MGPLRILAVLMLFAILFFPGWLRRALAALAEGLNNFRGGPPPPMHPTPADDGVLLQRRSRKVGH
jgi:hypothetical protein